MRKLHAAFRHILQYRYPATTSTVQKIGQQTCNLDLLSINSIGILLRRKKWHWHFRSRQLMVQPTTIYSALQSFDQQNKGTADICGRLLQSEVNGLGSMHYLTVTTPKACGLNLELKLLQYTFPWQNPKTTYIFHVAKKTVVMLWAIQKVHCITEKIKTFRGASQRSIGYQI